MSELEYEFFDTCEVDDKEYDWFLGSVNKYDEERLLNSYKSLLPTRVMFYGTLRVGMCNHSMVETFGCEYIETRRIPGYSLWRNGNSIVPYAHPDDNGTITVDCFFVDDPKAMLAFDNLEGHPTVYRRTWLKNAWIYLDANPTACSLYGKQTPLVKVPNGDYSRWMLHEMRQSVSAEIREYRAAKMAMQKLIFARN